MQELFLNYQFNWKNSRLQKRAPLEYNIHYKEWIRT